MDEKKNTIKTKNQTNPSAINAISITTTIITT